MKLVTFSQDASIRPGILIDGGIIDIVSFWGDSNAPRSIKEILTRGPSCMERLAELAESAKASISLDSVKLLAPIPRPGKILALAGNYAKHIIEAGLKLGLSDSPRFTTVPRPFLMPPTVVAGPGDEIPWPVFSETIDYEIELAIVIGKRAKCIDADQASDYIAGYTIANDISARTVTFKKDRAERPWDEFYDWLNGKWGDGFCPMGPYILTADEIEDVQNLNLRLTVNGQERQNSNTSQMIHPVVEIVSFCSHLMTLEPGDIIATGTPSGVGMATGDYLEAGDRIEATIGGLGTLANTLGARPEEFYHPLTEVK
ncbi:MAG: fumarylacetoacetate hydrolase family protein [Planctomycetota bacterium]|jgi:2-keto-4-pentenoate hydratase/2-oxohepta-3-ene-1,7-dioic acid hydratase in catechol pathway